MSTLETILLIYAVSSTALMFVYRWERNLWMKRTFEAQHQPERPEKTAEIERQKAGTGADGTWPKDCPQRLFVYGAAWWHWKFTGTTLYPHERDELEAEAVRRYGEPGEGSE